MKEKRIYASVSETPVIVLALPFSKVYSQEQVAFLIWQGRGYFQPTSAAGMSFSPIFTIISKDITTSLRNFPRCLRLNVTSWIFIMSDHLVLVFHMHQGVKPLNPMLMNKTRQSKQLRPCMEGESKKTPAQKVKRWSFLSHKICQVVKG